MTCNPCTVPSFLPANPLRSVINPEESVKVACDYFNVPLAALQTKSRYRTQTEIRAMLSEYLVTRHQLYMTTVARLFNRDHTTIIHARRVHSNLLQTDPDFRKRWMLFMNHMDDYARNSILAASG